MGVAGLQPDKIAPTVGLNSKLNRMLFFNVDII